MVRFWTEEHLKKKKNKKNHKRRTAQKNTKRLFVCFKNGLFPKKKGCLFQDKNRSEENN